jgi:uncharacterized protein YjbJ (UPF0337 family)
MDMNADILKGNWKQLKGTVKKQWGKLTDDDVARIEGRQEKLAGVLQEKYGYTREEAEKEIDSFLSSHK